MVKKCDNTFTLGDLCTRYDTIHERDRHPDRQMDMAYSVCRALIASRDKNAD